MTLNKVKTLTLLAASALAPAAAQVSAQPERFSPQTAGYMERAREMRTAGNFAGVIDQLGHLLAAQAHLSDSQKEELAFLLAEAWYERGDKRCLELLAQFHSDYPASPLAPKARMALADWHFFRHEWPQALTAYNEVDADRLNPQLAALCTYRRMLCMIKTGYFREARQLLRKLDGKKEYADAREFYNAYLDYIDGDFDRAYEEFARVPDNIPGLDAGYYMTQIDYSRRRYDRVISRGRSLLRADSAPELAPEINRIVGLSYFKTDNFADARPFLREYLDTAPADPAADALYALGCIEYADGDYQQAADLFEKITDRRDAIGQGAWLYLGQCHLRNDNPSSAAIAFEKATRMNFDPQVGESALYNYVTAVTRGGKVPFSSSSELLESFVNRYPDSEYTPEVEAYLATAYYNDREYARALECIDAIRRPSASILATRQKTLYQLGVEAITNGHADKAVSWLSQAAAMTKQDRELAAQSSLWLGDAYASLGRYAEAQRAYQAALDGRISQTNRDLTLYNLAYAKFKQRNYAGAATDFARVNPASRSLPQRVLDDALVRRADCLYYTGRYSEARELFNKAVNSSSADRDYALYRRATLNGLAGDSKGKLADLRSLVDEHPDSRWRADALLEQAHMYEEQGRNDLAAEAYGKRLETVTDIDIDELLRMAQTMHRSGRADELLAVTARIRATGGLDADELADLSLMEADAMMLNGRDDEASEIYAQLAQNPTSAAGSQAAVTLAENLIKKGDYEGARESMEEFTDAGTPHSYWLARGFIALADAHHALGDTSLAREYLISLRDNYPGTEADINSMISSRLKKWK